MTRHGAILGLGGSLADGDQIEMWPCAFMALPPLARRICVLVRKCAVSFIVSTPSD